MKKRTLQIDVTGTLDDIAMVECKIIINNGRTCLFYTSKANYEALIYDGVFIRDGKEKDSANILNTTHVFEERR
jgi:hypothetical protein